VDVVVIEGPFSVTVPQKFTYFYNDTAQVYDFAPNVLSVLGKNFCLLFKSFKSYEFFS
jgi:hypothetical protein